MGKCTVAGALSGECWIRAAAGAVYTTLKVGALRIAPRPDPYEVLESGRVLMLPDVPFTLSTADREILYGVRLAGAHHKNISYKSHADKVCGLDKTAGPVRSRIESILRNFSQSAVVYAARLLPRYSQTWRVDYASLRPIEEAGRNLPFHQRNDLLHVDAFPSRPTRGGLILRLFMNVNPSKPRVWVISEPFEIVARRYARASGLERTVRRKQLVRTMLRRLGLPLAERSAYDEFMLAFHDYLKGNAEFQANCPKYRLEFPPGSAWVVFTDVVPHAVESGQFALEQTIIVPRDALMEPRRAPISILEALIPRL